MSLPQNSGSGSGCVGEGWALSECNGGIPALEMLPCTVGRCGPQELTFPVGIPVFPPLCSLFLLVLFNGGHDACVEVTGKLWRVGTLLLCEFRGWTLGRLLSDGRTEITELCGWKPVKCEPFTLRFALCGL